MGGNGAFQIDLTETDVAGIANGGHHYLIVQAGIGGTFGAPSRPTQLIVDNVAPALDLTANPAREPAPAARSTSPAAPPTASSATRT